MRELKEIGQTWAEITGRAERQRRELLGFETKWDWQDFLRKTAEKARKAFEKSTRSSWSTAVNEPIEIVGFYSSAEGILPIAQFRNFGCFAIVGKTAKEVTVKEEMVTFPWGNVLKAKSLGFEEMKEIVAGPKNKGEVPLLFIPVLLVKNLLLPEWQGTSSAELEGRKKLLKTFTRRVKKSHRMV